MLSDVLSSTGLTLSGLRTLQLTRKDAEDYLEAYKGVVAEYSRWGVLSPAPALAPLPRAFAATCAFETLCYLWVPFSVSFHELPKSTGYP